MELTQRKRQILKVVVEDHIRTAEPVGSKTIAAEMTGKVSSATIRNELADLTEMGYLEQPHTSAGRVPSPKGYRFYVNELMERQSLSEDETERINESLQLRMGEMDRVMSQAGKALSSIVNYPTYMTTTRKRALTVRRFDLLHVDDGSCIVVMMMSSNRVKSQLLQLQLRVEQEQLPALVNLLNTHFVNISQYKICCFQTNQLILPSPRSGSAKNSTTGASYPSDSKTMISLSPSRSSGAGI